jgi:hypothetical protein
VKIALEILKGNRAPEITYIETKVIDSSNVAEFKAYLNQYKQSRGRQEVRNILFKPLMNTNRH